MSTTPQMIKDQEFQTKFRGYDPIEVKAYLESIAEEFFELQERCRLHVEDMQLVHEEKSSLEQRNSVMESEVQEARKMAEELRKTRLISEQRLAVSVQETEGLRSQVASLEQEKKGLAEELKEAKNEIQQAEDLLSQEMGEKEDLTRKIELIYEQQREAKQDEVDFKSTLVAAQQFCDSMKEKSQQQAEQLLDGVRAEIEELRRSAHAELIRLPQEIQMLQKKHREAVRAVRNTLESYLHTLEIFPPENDEAPAPVHEENDELFQKIKILEDGALTSEDIEALTKGTRGMNAAFPVDGENLPSTGAGEEN